MTPRIVLDENVSLAVARHLRGMGYEVEAIVEGQARGMGDNAVFDLAKS